jgi:hypothetical protein
VQKGIRNGQRNSGQGGDRGEGGNLMPNSLAGLAQRFPAEKEGQSLEEQVRELRDYSYQLLEYLRYALQNLEPSNFNETEMEKWTNQITEPVYGEIRDANGNIAQLAVTADTIAARMENVAGDVSLVQQQANNITLAVSGLSDDLTGVKSTMVTVDKNGMIVNTDEDTTFISGATIKTGTITADHLQAGTFEAILESGNITSYDLKSSAGKTYGQFMMSGSNNDVHVGSLNKSDLYVTAAGDLYINGASIELQADTTVDGDLKLSNGDVDVHSDLKVWVSSTRYWSFDSSGIHYCDKDGNKLNHVALTN